MRGLALRRPQPAPAASAAVLASSILAITAYTPDCVLEGSAAQPAGRLTDVLAQAAIEVAGVILTALDDGRRVEAPTISLELADVCLVVLSDARGDAQRRVRTRQQPVVLQAGPYRIHGDLHAVPSADPIARVGRRVAVPLTGVLVAYTLAGERVEREHDAVLLNAAAMEWIDEAPGLT